MCGIAGILNFQGQPAGLPMIRKMTDRMSHRGPDADGFFTENNISLGHRRLSIIDLSTMANQPFTDNSGRYCMVFNGEIYNYKEIKPLLTGYDFRTTSDTEVLIAAYARWGTNCLQYLRGMYSIAIWDRQEQQLFLARDRMGVKPLYYSIDSRCLIFASEIRAILGTGLTGRKLNDNALVEYLSYQSIGFPLSAVEGIQQLEAGTWMRVKNGTIDKGSYWDPVSKATRDFDFGDKQRVQKKIRELMLQSVRRRLVSDVPVGAFLSGGIDSSAVVGLMAEAGSGKPNTFTIAFEEEQFDESPYAEMVAKKFDTRHTNILLKPDVFLDELQNALDAMDTPSGDGINTYVVSKVIRRQGMTVALSGVGGDELFAGYPIFGQYLQLQTRSWLWDMPPGFRRLAGAVLSARAASGRGGRMRQLLNLPSCGIDQTYPIFRQILSPRLIEDLTTLTHAQTTHTDTGRQLIAIEDGLRRLPLLSQVSVAEYLGYTQHTLLKDTDQMSMAASLEVREPFFDQDLVEFVLGIPDALKKPEYPKSLLVESLKPLLPEEVVFRKKQGFLFPWKVWLRNELRPFCDLRIKHLSQRHFIKGDQLLSHWQRFLKGDEEIRWAEIWLFVVLEYWLEKNSIC